MAVILKSKSIYFNDIVMLPKLGKVRSRKDVPVELYRVIVSPMVSVVGETFIIEAAKLGLSVALPRFIKNVQKIRLATLFHQNKNNDKQLCFMSIGMNESDESLNELSKNYSFQSRDWLVDVASGYTKGWQTKGKELRSILGDNLHNLMVGNVVTIEGVDYLINNLMPFCYNLFTRNGIGNGSQCSTSDNAAINRGQVTELMECSESEIYKQNKDHCFLVSDGGIKSAGYALKAYACGASYVLMGGYFVKAIEAETNVKGEYTYFGCASEKQNKLAGLDKHSEGKEMKINKEELKPLSYLVKELWGGISSGVSYSGYTSLSELIGNGIFEIKQNSLPPRNRM